MSTLSLDNSTDATTAANNALRLRAVLAALLALSGLAGVGGYSWVETLTLGCMLVAAFAGLWLWRGAVNLSANSAGRLWLAACFVSGVVLLAPVFQRQSAATAFDDMSMPAKAATVLFMLAALLLTVLGRRAPRTTIGTIDPDAPLAERIEDFLSSLRVRANLAVLAVLLTIGGLALGGLPMRTLLPRICIFAATVLALDAILKLAAHPGGARALSGTLLFVLAVNTAAGAVQFGRLWSKVGDAEKYLQANQPDAAKTAHAEITALNKIMGLSSAQLAMERQLAEYHERTGNLRQALAHWTNVADMQRIDRAEYLPIQRVLCKLGDSLNAYRRLIRDGFPAITHPELAQGVKALGDIPGGDLRGKLLSALLAWEQDAPETERRARLEAVQAQSKLEPTSYTLLKRLKVAVPDAKELWLPNDLLVGARPTLDSLLGNIQEVGELSALVALDEGNWEVGLKARATPLNEEWPIVSLELDGYEVGRSQVNRAVDHEVPFTFQIKRRGLFRLNIKFINHAQQLEAGRLKMRGLYIHGLVFRRGKN